MNDHRGPDLAGRADPASGAGEPGPGRGGAGEGQGGADRGPFTVDRGPAEETEMKITIESTPTITEIDGVPVRVWMGTTGAGTHCKVFVHRIAVLMTEDTAAFDAELKEQLPPGRYVPLSSIL